MFKEINHMKNTIYGLQWKIKKIYVQKYNKYIQNHNK